MRYYKTRVERIGAFWKVQRLRYGICSKCGQWETVPDNFCTRLAARNARAYWAWA